MKKNIRFPVLPLAITATLCLFGAFRAASSRLAEAAPKAPKIQQGAQQPSNPNAASPNIFENDEVKILANNFPVALGTVVVQGNRIAIEVKSLLPRPADSR